MLRGFKFKEPFVGLALTVVLPTRYRLADGIGAGEIALAAFAFVMIALALLQKKAVLSGAQGRVAGILAAYVFVVLLPMTLIGLYFNVPGVSFRDWIAFALSSVFVLGCIFGRLDILSTARYLVAFLCCLILVQYLFGGDTAWYFSRFTAGASNPNQLALYVVCGFMLALVAIQNNVARALAIAILIFAGALTGSDAVLAAAAATALTYFTSRILPKRVLVFAGPVIICLAVWLWMVLGPDVGEWMTAEWSGADEGGSRSTLYKNGLAAWLDTPLTVFMGNGAGSFSGLIGPYGWAEAHNTPIDMLAVGGFFGFLVCYWGFLYLLLRSYRHGMSTYLAVLVGLVVFSLFHYVGRQPIWWFSLIVLAQGADLRIRQRKTK